MVVTPAPNNRVQESDKVLLFGRLVPLDDFGHFGPESAHVILCRFLQVLPLLPVLPHVPAEEVESVANVRDSGLFRRKR